MNDNNTSEMSVGAVLYGYKEEQVSDTPTLKDKYDDKEIEIQALAKRIVTKATAAGIQSYKEEIRSEKVAKRTENEAKDVTPGVQGPCQSKAKDSMPFAASSGQQSSGASPWVVWVPRDKGANMFVIKHIVIPLCVWLLVSYIARTLKGYENYDNSFMSNSPLAILSLPEKMVCNVVGCPIRGLLLGASMIGNTMKKLGSHPLTLAAVMMSSMVSFLEKHEDTSMHGMPTSTTSRHDSGRTLAFPFSYFMIRITKFLYIWLLVSFIAATVYYGVFGRDCEDGEDDCGFVVRQLFGILAFPEKLAGGVVDRVIHGASIVVTTPCNVLMGLACHPIGIIGLIMAALLSYVVISGNIRIVSGHLPCQPSLVINYR